MFTSFLPAVSKDALKKMSATVRSWRLRRRTGLANEPAHPGHKPGRARLIGIHRS